MAAYSISMRWYSPAGNETQIGGTCDAAGDQFAVTAWLEDEARNRGSMPAPNRPHDMPMRVLSPTRDRPKRTGTQTALWPAEKTIRQERSRTAPLRTERMTRP